MRLFIGNFKGPKGDKGDTGARGATGPQGPKGDSASLPFQLGIDDSGNCGYIKPGADTVTPFRRKSYMISCMGNALLDKIPIFNINDIFTFYTNKDIDRCYLIFRSGEGCSQGTAMSPEIEVDSFALDNVFVASKTGVITKDNVSNAHSYAKDIYNEFGFETMYVYRFTYNYDWGLSFNELRLSSITDSDYNYIPGIVHLSPLGYNCAYMVL